MPEYLSKEEIRKWRSSLERITLEEYAARLGKVIEEEKHEKRKKTKRAKKEKPVKTEKRKKEKKAVEKSVKATPIENPRKEKYESEFDDILFDLERSKAPKEEENIDISKDGDGNGGDEA